MRAIIIDDEPSAIKALQQALQEYPDITIAGTAPCGMEGISMVKSLQPDLLFLDVELPDLSGLDFLRQLTMAGQTACRTIVYTAHPAYMLEAFRGRAFDFLLKPVDTAELRKVIQRCYFEAPTRNSLPTGKDADKLLLYVNATDFRVVNTRDVGLFQYNHDLRIWEVVLAGSDSPVRLKRTANNDALLNLDRRFIQVSQRHIININYLLEVTDGYCRFFPPFDHIRQVKVGRTYKKQLTDRFNSL